MSDQKIEKDIYALIHEYVARVYYEEDLVEGLLNLIQKEREEAVKDYHKHLGLNTSINLNRDLTQYLAQTKGGKDE